MNKQTINGTILKQMISGGTSSLNQAKREIDKLNVFPVPDGDTGTNMDLTMQSAKKEAMAVSDNHIGEVAKALSKGALMGARGNSGVILSQLFRGFAKMLEPHAEVDLRMFAKALTEGVNTAYKAVMKPVEGTILTVAKDSSKAARRYALANEATNLEHLLTYMIEQTDISVQHTPSKLKVLRDAGVVDAGGKGLYYIYRGFLKAIKQEGEVEDTLDSISLSEEARAHMVETDLKEATELIYQYCTEFMITNLLASAEQTTEKLQETLIPYGNSMMVVDAEDVVKIHIHTNRPGLVLDQAIGYGELTHIKIDNMKEQHNAKILEPEKHATEIETGISEMAEVESQNTEQVQRKQPEANISVIAVVSGDGFADIFTSLGVEHVIKGGQTMNPSTETILNKIHETLNDKVLVLPNNKNIILACEQAKKIAEKEVVVIPTKTMPEGISAMIAFDPEEDDLNEAKKQMEESTAEIFTGEVTYAVRDSNYGDLEIKKDDIIALINDEIKTVGEEPERVLKQALQDVIKEDHEIITLYYGEDIESERAEKFVEELSQVFQDCEVELHYGGQPLYFYNFSVE